MIRRFAALALAGAALTALLPGIARAAQTRVDAQLLADLRADSLLPGCGCIVAAAWLDTTYPRVTVDSARWRMMSGPARSRFRARALEIAEATYLAENAATDRYERSFIVDRSGQAVFDFHPMTR